MPAKTSERSWPFVFQLSTLRQMLSIKEPLRVGTRSPAINGFSEPTEFLQAPQFFEQRQSSPGQKPRHSTCKPGALRLARLPIAYSVAPPDAGPKRTNHWFGPQWLRQCVFCLFVCFVCFLFCFVLLCLFVCLFILFVLFVLFLLFAEDDGRDGSYTDIMWGWQMSDICL